jgi:hypothetical protein
MNHEYASNEFTKAKREDMELRCNGEGYADPTAYEAIKRTDHDDPERARFLRVVGCILRICELAGYRLEEKLVLRDQRTGKVWF